MNQPETIETQALTVVEHPQPPAVGLFGTTDPVTVVQKAREVADALKDVISKQGLISKISGKEYPRCEAWTLLGTMLGVYPVLIWTRQLDEGWEARVEAKTRDGAVVGAAEAQCLRGEKNWSNRDDFALRSMAQTRATAKCLRMPLGFVMTLAGYEPTPAEEMVSEPSQTVKTPPRASQTPTKPVSGPAQTTVSESEEDAANRAEFLRVLDKQLPRNAKAGFERWLANVPQKFSKAGGETGEKVLLLPTEGIEDLSLPWLRHFANKLSELAPVVDMWLSEHPENVSQEAQPELPAGPSDPDAKDAPWRSFPVPWGKDAGVPLGELDKKKLYGWWANYTVEYEYNGKPKSPTDIAKCEMFRKMLNEAGAHHKFTKDN